MTTKSNPDNSKSGGKRAAAGRRPRKRPTKSDRPVRLLKADAGRDIAALSRNLGWLLLPPGGADPARESRLRHRKAAAPRDRQVALPDRRRTGRAEAMTMAKDRAVGREIAALEELDRTVLLECWRVAFGRDAPPRLSRILKELAIAYDLQAKTFGGLSARTIRALKAAARADSKPATNRLASCGVRLVREWNGALHEVEVLEDGYLWRGQRHRSLSAIARAITGTKWSGPRFFGLKGRP